MSSAEVQRDLKYIYCWNYYTMRFLGIWPEERRWNLPSSYLVLMPILLMLGFVCIPQTANLPRIWHDLYLIVENLSMANITVSITVIKTIAFWIHGTPLKSLLGWMAKDWGSEMQPNDKEIMKDIGRLTRSMIMKCTLMCNTVIITYVILRQLTMMHDDAKFFFRAYFPYDTNVSPNFELTFFGQLITATFAAACYTSVDTFVVMLILHVCGQLLILKKDIKSLHSYSKHGLKIQLRKIVRKHNYLNKFAEKIEKCFNVMLLLQMLACTVQLCFQCFQVVVSIGVTANEILVFQISFLLLYVVYVMVQLFLYCYVGEKLSVESTEIAVAAYECEWYNLSPKDAQLLMIVIQRARLPLQITAGRFCSFTLVLYSQILKTSMGYISVLYATKGQ